MSDKISLVLAISPDAIAASRSAVKSLPPASFNCRAVISPATRHLSAALIVSEYAIPILSAAAAKSSESSLENFCTALVAASANVTPSNFACSSNLVMKANPVFMSASLMFFSASNLSSAVAFTFLICLSSSPSLSPRLLPPTSKA